ncbi:hypothetical protein Hanom_Chr01g00086681 [Helianthus anomalus]
MHDHTKMSRITCTHDKKLTKTTTLRITKTKIPTKKHLCLCVKQVSSRSPS